MPENPTRYRDARPESDLFNKASMGEQQRLAFARALLQNPDFLFVDEATSALDPMTEHSLYETLERMLPKTAIVSVAHRESLKKFHQHFLILGESMNPDPVSETKNQIISSSRQESDGLTAHPQY